MKRLWTPLILSILFSCVSAKFYVQEMSDDVKSIRDYNDALNLFKRIVPVSESNERSESSVEIPIEWDSDISSILRRRTEKECYQKKHLNTVCIQACVEAIDLGCHESWCENKHKMKEFCDLPCKLTYNQYRF